MGFIAVLLLFGIVYGCVRLVFAIQDRQRGNS